MTIKKSEAIKFLDSLIVEKESFGGFLQAIREADKISQTRFSKKLRISKQHLCDIEKGRKLVSPERAAKFSKTLGYSEKSFVALALQDSMRNGGLHYKVELKVA